jgi:hypothetical protein
MAVLACAAGTPYLTEPSLCPTRPEIAFVSGGDIWVASSAGGEAHILVAHPVEESRPLYSPDGTPGTLIQGSDGKNMENNPRPVDIAVTRPIGEAIRARIRSSTRQ